MKSLFNECLSYVSDNLSLVGPTLDQLPPRCKEWLLEWIACHDGLSSSEAQKLLSSKVFFDGLRQIHFYLSDQLTDDMLSIIGQHNHLLQHVSIVFCSKITNRGVRAITQSEKSLVRLELRGLLNVTAYGIAAIAGEDLRIVDFSECPGICSSGIIQLVTHCKKIQRLCLNGCIAVDDIALYAIASHLNSNLISLELDFLVNLVDPASAINYLTEHCPNLMQLSLCRFFEPLMTSDLEYLNVDCRIKCNQLRELDLFGNYFSVLPTLPPSIDTLRLSCNGTENVTALVESLRSLPQLASVRILLTNREINETAVKAVNGFLETLITEFGQQITSLQIMAYQIKEKTMRKLLENCSNLNSMSLDVIHVPVNLLMRLLSEEADKVLLLKTLKFYHMKLPHKLLASLARNCINVEEIETSFMDCVDDRFLKLLATHCPNLQKVNFNGCRWVTDKGICELARKCPLKEIRVRGTPVTDKCVIALAAYCHDLEWIAHADYTGKPKFSAGALKKLKESCNARVIC